MANKIIAIMLALMLLTIMPLALAEDTNVGTTIDVNTIDSTITPIDEREARSMLAPFGAEVRMLQLEKSVTRNVLIGDIILQTINNNHEDANTIEAENTLNSMEMLLEEIKSTSTDQDKNELVQVFVELKKEARTLSATFKQQTKNLITSEDRKEIMTQIKEIDRNQLTNITNAIKEQAKNFNAKRIQEKFKSMGIDNEPLVERIRNGDANFLEVKNYALNNFKDFNEMEKKRIATNMKNDSIKRVVQGKEIIQKFKSNLEQKLLNTLQNRAENMNQWMEQKMIDANENGNVNRVQRLEQQSERVEGIIDQIQNKIQGGRAQ